jgi:hypothetical protein
MAQGNNIFSQSFNGPNVYHMSVILKTACHQLNRDNCVTFQFFHVSVEFLSVILLDFKY